MVIQQWEYARENVLDLDKDKGTGWRVMGRNGWELVAIYEKLNMTGVHKFPVAVFKRPWA